MYSVEIHKYDHVTGDHGVYGRILSDGKSVTCDPADSVLLQNIAIDPVFVKGKGLFEPDIDPVGFLKALSYQYKSSYLVAMPMQGGDDESSDSPKPETRQLQSRLPRQKGVVRKASFFEVCDRIPAGQEDAGACKPASGGSGGTSGTQNGTKVTPQDDYKQHGVKAASFKNWFGDWESDPSHASKVTHPNGQPKETNGVVKVFHGTHYQFNAFDKSKEGTGGVGRGFYFAEDRTIADHFADAEWQPGKVLECYLNIRKPFDLDSPVVPEVMEKILTLAGIEPDKADAIRNKCQGKPARKLWVALSNLHNGRETVNAVIQKAGYDGIVHTAASEQGGLRQDSAGDEDWGRVWIAFEPNQIKATENSGDFSRDVDIYKKLRNRLRKDWVETDHPRGQPENAGEFAPVSGTPSSRLPKSEAGREAVDAAREDYEKNGTKAKAFKQWFGESKVVNPKGEPQDTYGVKPSKVTHANGEPIIVYHGTQADFDAFDPAKQNPEALYGPGFYFTEDKTVARAFSHGNSFRAPDANAKPEEHKQSKLLACYLKITKPFDADAHFKRLLTGKGIAKLPYDVISSALGGNAKAQKKLQDLGYDGITHTGRDMGNGQHRVWIAFKPNQIKAVKNQGTFDDKDPSILKRYQKDWSESDHPRGQPENAGQFAPSSRLPGKNPDAGKHDTTSNRHGRAEYPSEAERHALKKLEFAPPPEGEKLTQPECCLYRPDPKLASKETGIPEHSRVGVKASDVPPPPKEIPRLPNLTDKERAVESRFADAFLENPDAMVKAYRDLQSRQNGVDAKGRPVWAQGDPPNVFNTDNAKLLSPDYKDGDDDDAKFSRGAFNVAVHQTANAIAKRAFVQKLDEMKELPEDERHVLVTSGGCSAGKGALQFMDETKDMVKHCPAVWDAAGEQNATENPWVLDECRKRGIKVTYAFVHADAEGRWGNPEGGVVERAKRIGRMVDARLYADSYALGAKNFQAFHEKHKGDDDVKFLFVDTSKGTMQKPRADIIDGIPDAALQLDSDTLYQKAVAVVQERSDKLPQGVVRGGTIGERVWGKPKGKT